MMIKRYVNKTLELPAPAQEEAAKPCNAMWRRHRTRVLDGSIIYFLRPGNVLAPKRERTNAMIEARWKYKPHIFSGGCFV